MLAETVEAVVRRELVFVNDNVNAYEILINGIRESDTNRTIEIVVLDANRDGIQQVSDILAEHSNLAVMHVIAYGTDGQINLGNNWLNSTTLQQKSDAAGNFFITWASLNQNGSNYGILGQRYDAADCHSDRSSEFYQRRHADAHGDPGNGHKH